MSERPGRSLSTRLPGEVQGDALDATDRALACEAEPGRFAEDHNGQEHSLHWLEMARIALVGVAAVSVWMRLWEPISAFSILGLAGLLIGGWPIFKEAFESVVAKRMTMELSMSIAIGAAAAISEFFTALVITLFVLVAEVLEGMTVSRGRRAIRDLVDFLPRAVSVRRGGGGDHGRRA